MSLRNLTLYLKEIGVDYIDKNGIFKKHWVLENPKLKKNDVMYEIFRLVGEERLRYSGFSFRKSRTCGCPNCVNPECYNIFVSNKSEFVDMLELAEDIDLERYYEIGEKLYLEEFNESQPDYLKITPKQLKLAVLKLKGDTSDETVL